MDMCDVIGIDEAGRGPLAGPVTVAAFGMKPGFRLKNFPKGRDSKKMSEKERGMWFAIFVEEQKKGNVWYEVAHASVKVIDTKGIVGAIQKAMGECLNKVSDNTKILLDGALKAPARFTLQKTIIKGDEKETLIACASIVAKVTRDTYMTKLAQTYADYGFELHKGYGTKKHREIIVQKGLTKAHRSSFCRNLPK